MNAPTRVTAAMAWSGSRYIDVSAPRADDINIWDVATGLSREARYGGSCTRIFWSVAQHSILVDHLAEQDGVHNAVWRLCLLLHDAPEYMLRDLIRPVKRFCPDYRVLEDRWWRAVAEKFDLPVEMPALVKHYDDLACSCEKAALVSRAAGPWPGLPEARPIPDDLLDIGMNDARDRLIEAVFRQILKR